MFAFTPPAPTMPLPRAGSTGSLSRAARPTFRVGSKTTGRRSGAPAPARARAAPAGVVSNVLSVTASLKTPPRLFAQEVLAGETRG